MSEHYSYREPVFGRPATIDRMLAISLLLIIGAGCITVFSASSAHGLNGSGRAGHFLLSHLRNLAIGLSACLIMMRVDYHQLRPLAWPVMLLTALGLLLTLILGHRVNGAIRWFSIGPIRVQLAEPCRFAVVLFMAAGLAQIQDFRKQWLSLLPYLGLVASCLTLIYLQPNYSTLMIIALVAGGMLFLAGMPLSWITLGGASLSVPAALLMMKALYRSQRVLEWKEGFLNVIHPTDQVMQSYIALGRGGLRGNGVGESLQKLFYLPEPFNDFIFSIFGEECGLVGCLLLLAAYAFVFLRGLNIMRRTRDEFGRMLAGGITLVFFMQTLINLMTVTGLMPPTGQALPLFSYGGSSMVAMMGALGILLNISYQARRLDR